MARKNEAKWKRIVASVKAGSKGGKSGQWSARKAQLATLRYKKSGGTYTGPKTKAQKSLSKWTKEKWGTKSGKNSTQGDKATGERYLPKKVREGLTKKEYEKTSAKKRADTKKGKQVSKQPKRIAKKTSKLKGPSMDGNRKGYKKVISEESGSTEQGRKTVVATYRPFRGLSKVVERDIEYRTPTSPRNKIIEKEVTKRYGDGSVKSYKNIVKQNGSIVSEVTTPKVKYKKREKPFGKKIGANMKGVPHYKKDGTEYKGATHNHKGKGLMSGEKHTSSSVNLFHKDEIPGPNLVGNQSKIDMNRDGKITKKDFDMLNRGPSMQGSWMRKHIKG